jgi:nicotinate-nucleotide adenylyltransferase
LNRQEQTSIGTSASSAAGVRRIAFYGGSFDPLHNGHFAISKALVRQFGLQQFVFVPAFHAPHKAGRAPTSAYHRFAMLALSTADDPVLRVSPMEVEMPERPYTVETLGRLLKIYKATEIFFVMGADSWEDICTWREWERVLSLTNHIVVTRPGYEIDFQHVTQAVRERIVDLRGTRAKPDQISVTEPKIYISDAVRSNASASRIRTKIKENSDGWQTDVPETVANYIEKYELYT